MKRGLSILVSTVLVSQTLAAAQGERAIYIGGTVAIIPRNALCTLNLDDPKSMRLRHRKVTLEIPYGQIQSVEFGQKVGHAPGTAAILGAATLGLAALPILMAKKKRHLLTIAFTNANGGNEALVFELPKGDTRTAIPILEARTGKRIEVAETTKDTGKPPVARRAPAPTPGPLPPQ